MATMTAAGCVLGYFLLLVMLGKSDVTFIAAEVSQIDFSGDVVGGVSDDISNTNSPWYRCGAAPQNLHVSSWADEHMLLIEICGVTPGDYVCRLLPYKRGFG